MPFVVASSDWWVYWPMRYAAMTTPRATMLLGDAMNEPEYATILQKAMRSGNMWFAEFAGSQNAANLRRGLIAGEVQFKEYSTTSYSDQPVVTVFHLLPSKTSR
jgi:hypothetical protein